MKKIPFILFIVNLFITSSAIAAGTLYAVNADCELAYVWKIDQTTAAATKVVQIKAEGGGISLNLSGAAFLNNKLWLSDVFQSIGYELKNFGLGWVDLSTGIFTFEHDQGDSICWLGLAADQTAGILYSIDLLGDNTLVSYDPVSHVQTNIGCTGDICGRGMCYDNQHGILYATMCEGKLYSIDKTSGAASFIGNLPFEMYLGGLAYDEIDDVIWAITRLDDDGCYLYKVDPYTAASTYVGDIGDYCIDNLAWTCDGAIPAPGAIILAGLGTAIVSHLRRKKTI